MPSHFRNCTRLDESSHNWDSLAPFLYALRELAAYFLTVWAFGINCCANDSTSGIRIKDHGFDFRIRQMCIGVGGKIVDLKGYAFYPMVEGYVGSSYVRNGVRLGGPNHLWSCATMDGPSHNWNSWALYLYALNELVAYFLIARAFGINGYR